jgi:hypothetical protein
MKLALTAPNAAAVSKYADLVGLTPEKFLNKFLKEELTPFEDLGDGRAEEYLIAFRFKDRATAERLAAWIRDRFNRNTAVHKFEVEVIESPKGKFRVSAAFFSRGQMSPI